MSKFVIKKRVSLEFLGDEYKEAYLIFQSIPVKDFQDIIGEIEKSGDDTKGSLNMIQGYLHKYFIEGKFPNASGELEVVTADDMSEFVDSVTANKCFELLTGQNIDPKVEAPSTNISTMEPDLAST